MTDVIARVQLEGKWNQLAAHQQINTYENVIIHTTEVYSAGIHANMGCLESLKLREVIQTQKDKNHTLLLTCGS